MAIMVLWYSGLTKKLTNDASCAKSMLVYERGEKGSNILLDDGTAKNEGVVDEVEQTELLLEGSSIVYNEEITYSSMNDLLHFSLIREHNTRPAR